MAKTTWGNGAAREQKSEAATLADQHLQPSIH